MPYVNIKPPKIQGAVAKIIGKAQGKVAEDVTKKLIPLLNNVRKEGCPNLRGVQSNENKINGINRSLARVDRRVSKFRKIPRTVLAPVNALEKIVSIIKKIPIPQSVPPGFGLPVAITTVYADLLHLIKEKIVQAKEIAESVEAVLDTPENFLSSTRNLINRASSATLSCKVQAKLQEEVNNGNLNIKDLQASGVVDQDEIFIFSKLVPRFIGNLTLNNDGTLSDSSSVNNLSQGTGADGLKQAQEQGADGLKQAQEQLEKTLQALDKSGIDQSVKDDLRRLIGSLRDLSAADTVNEQQFGAFNYVDANGRVFILDIVNDPKAPSIAPRKFAVAKDPVEGVVLLRGTPSFTTDITVLLDEIKFRLDNQLP